MGFFVERKGYTRLSDVMYAVVADMKANGFTQKYPTSPLIKPADGSFAKFSVVMEPDATVNALSTVAQYAIRFECAPPVVLNGGTSQTAWETKYINDTSSTYADATGVDTIMMDITTPSLLNYTTGAIQYVDPDEQNNAIFWSRRRAMNYRAWPMSYALSITDRGIALCIWENDQDKEGNNFAWFVVQRPVDKTSGAQLKDDAVSHCPVVAIVKAGNNSLLNSYISSDVEYFTVCETDISRPSKRKSATKHEEDSTRLINSAKQVMIMEDGKYVIDFPCRFNTARYSYTQELDMVGITSADVVSAGSDVATTVYGEATPRTYYSLMANGANNTGMRFLFLKKGGGIA